MRDNLKVSQALCVNEAAPLTPIDFVGIVGVFSVPYLIVGCAGAALGGVGGIVSTRLDHPKEAFVVPIGSSQTIAPLASMLLGAGCWSLI